MKFSLLAAALAATFTFGAAQATTIVNLDAAAYSAADPYTYTGFQTIQLAAGTYDITVISDTYSGWTYKDGSNIREAFDISVDGGSVMTYDVSQPFSSYVTSAAALAAFATGPYDQFAGATDKTLVASGLTKIEFTTDGSGVTFGIPDNKFNDNTGGVSLAITAAVPEPETYALMLAGLGALGFVASRRKSA